MTMPLSRRELLALAPAAFALRAEGPRTWRADFPLLTGRNARPLIYLDTAATSQRPQAVIDATTAFYRDHNANPSASLHALARDAEARYDAARKTMAAFLNARGPEEIVWTRGTTDGINLVASAWASHVLKPGDEIVITEAEHYSNLLPWRFAAARTGATLRIAPVDAEGRLHVDAVAAQLTARTRIVAFSHVSNVCGYINPAADICAAAKRAGARVLIDAAQSTPHIPIDVQALGCDFLACSGHKMLGPMGVGVLWARRELLDEMPPYQGGSNMVHEVEGESLHYEQAALKFGAGTPNVAGAVGLAAAADYLTSAGRDAIRRHELTLIDRMLARMTSTRGLRLLGPATSRDRVGVFSFVIDGESPADTVRRLDARGIAIRAGDLAALPLLLRFGVRSAARASCYLYNTVEDIDRFADALQR
jgi:cysteine desulfurase/selenocysteine lyase